MNKTLKRVLRLTSFAIFSLTIAVAGALTFVCYVQAQALAYPGRAPIYGTPADFGAETWEDVTFTTADGLDLSGWYIPPTSDGGEAVLMVHGIGGNRSLYRAEMQLMMREGYGVLAFDLRNSGGSEGSVTSMGYYEVQDVEAAFDFLAAQPDVNPDHIAIYGFSMGAATSIRAMPRIPEARVLLADSGYASMMEVAADGVTDTTGLPPFPWAHMILGFTGYFSDANLFSLDMKADIANIDGRPVFIMHGARDGTIPVDHARRLYDAAEEPKELWIVDEAGHGGLWWVDPEGYEARVIPFLDEHLRAS